MGEQTGKGSIGSDQGTRNTSSETIGLDLTLEQASSLIVIIDYYGGQAKERIQMIRDGLKSNKIPKDNIEKVKELLLLEEHILGDASFLMQEVTEVMVELEKPKPLIIRPNWKG